MRTRVAYVRENNIYVESFRIGGITQLTTAMARASRQRHL